MPLNAPGYWYSIQDALTLFCDQRLISGPPLKTFKLELFDMLRNHVDPSIIEFNYTLNAANAPIFARFEDYEATLRISKRVAQKAKTCEISLPYWMQTHVRAGWLMKEWKTYEVVQLHFMPLATTSKAFNFHYIDHIWVPSWILRSDLEGIQMDTLELWKRFHPSASYDWGSVTREDFLLLADLA